MQKGTTAKIFSILAEAGQSTGEFLAMFLTDYATSYRMLRGLPIRGKRTAPDPQEFVRAEKQRFYNLLSKLKREKLIQRAQNGKWRLTVRGIKRSHTILQRMPPTHTYDPKPSRELILIVFDVPEKERRKRNWLRAALKRLNFRMLQQSVWMGKTELPETFLHDLRRMRLLSYVEILVITRTGSVRHLG